MSASAYEAARFGVQEIPLPRPQARSAKEQIQIDAAKSRTPGRVRYKVSITLTPEDEVRYAREQGAIAAAVEGVIP